MNVRFLVFLSIVTAVLSLSAFYVGSRAIAHVAWASAHTGVVWSVSAFFIVLQLTGPFLYRTFPDPKNRLLPLHAFVYVTLGAFACLFFYTLAVDLLILGWGLVFGFYGSPVERWAGAAIAVATVATVLIGIVQARGPRVYEVDIPLTDLPAAFEGFRIAQISDLHIGPMIGGAYAEKVVTTANGLETDVIVLTGDIVDGAVERLQEDAAALAGLQAKHGVYYVTGNHEYYWDAIGWISVFRDLGIKPLLNEHEIICRDGAALAIAGVTDEESASIVPHHVSDPRKAVEGAPPDAVKILLAHRPSNYKNVAEAGFKLQLSGHTHGGQFFPWSLVVGLAYRFTRGLYRHGDLWIYVNRGTGYWGPPIRFGVPGEVTLLRLTKASL